MTPDVLNSPAVALLCQLEADGFALAIDRDRLLVKPLDRLPPELRTQLAAYRHELVTLVRICDDDVIERRNAFARQLGAGVSIGALGLRPGLPYNSGCCFSCGDGLPRPVFGRCWKCALAWRLAAGIAIPPMLAEVYDAQRVVA